MRSLLLTVITSLSLSAAAFGQGHASWASGRSQPSALITINPIYARHVEAAAPGKSLWGVLQNNKVIVSDILGDYLLTEYDNSGTPSNTTAVTGKLSLLDAQADAAGNWYVLGRYFDTVHFTDGTTLVQDPFTSLASEYFLFRLNTGTLDVAWVKPVGATSMSNATVFTIKGSGLYMAVDSEYTQVVRYDLATGSSAVVLTQPFSSHTSSLAIDDNGGIYLAGSCAFTGLDFNGHVVATTSPYPAYLVRYKANGTHDWSYVMNDVTCVDRKISLGTDNTVYYTGTIHDTLSIGAQTFHHPAWVSDYLVCRFDTLGNLVWGTQLRDTLQGDAEIENADHAVVLADNTINVMSRIRQRIDWGNGVVTDLGSNDNAAIVNYAADGRVNWVKYVDGNFSTSQHLKTDGTDIWLTGNVADSPYFLLDAIEVPASGGGYTPFVARLHPDGLTTVPVCPGDVTATVYPNPATASLTIHTATAASDKSYMVMTDVAGRIVKELTLNGGYAPTTIDVSGLGRGLYFVTVSNGGKRTVQKVTLQ